MGWFKKGVAKSPDGTRIFFATDVHGSNICFKKFVGAAAFYAANVLILGGDTTGKMVVPVIRRGPGRWSASFQDQQLELASEEEVGRFAARVANMGFYPKVMDPDELDAYAASPESQRDLFLELIRQRWEEWIAYAEDKLRGTDVRVFAAPGNDDFFEVDEILAASERITMLEGKVHQLTEEHEILTTAWTNPTPWNTERECSEEELAERLERSIRNVHDVERCIFNIHVPPYNSRLDMCPKLDEDLKVVYNVGNPVQAPAGSTAVREAIERHQPLLGLHGHIHEGRGEAKIGRTLCLNPGSVYTEGILNGALITLSGGRVAGYQFTQG